MEHLPLRSLKYSPTHGMVKHFLCEISKSPCDTGFCKPVWCNNQQWLMPGAVAPLQLCWNLFARADVGDKAKQGRDAQQRQQAWDSRTSWPSQTIPFASLLPSQDRPIPKRKNNSMIQAAGNTRGDPKMLKLRSFHRRSARVAAQRCQQPGAQGAADGHPQVMTGHHQGEHAGLA